ncbi:peptidoglycan D,D-transpeptidase FtsI family protein [Thioalkalivibrio sp. HK1]|uniref:peptidoglycan D,D-transpeptidase FtsI family protein n=1 Tax=Thioalkalivibrio sp. HK1 TaxID=1469245 RepID=UPI00047114BD|nr:penicillin-binding transpeptidase domain-containing protein [Thioalkalivibrio sp. HK1]
MSGHPSSGFGARRWFLILMTLACAGGLIGRAVDLQVNRHEFLKGEGNARHLRVATIPVRRGMLLDRNGEPLAATAPVQSVWINPQELDERGETPGWTAIEKMLSLSKGTIHDIALERGDRQFVYLRRHVEPSLAQEIDALGVLGVHLQREDRRYYPMGEAAAHVVGFTDIDNRGQEGIELAFDKVLSGESGKKRVIRDRLGRNVEDVESIHPAWPGRDLTLSIDRRIQAVAHRSLLEAVRRHDAKAGSAVVLNVHSGEVLAVVNQPSYNPNKRGDRSNHKLRNRAITDLFEPGSTVKPFTVAAALASGSVQPDTEVNTSPGFMRVGGYVIRDIRDFGVLDVTGIIRKSSNVGAAKLGLSLAPRDLWRGLDRMGLATSTGSGFPGEAYGTLPDFSTWGEARQVTLSYGYGLSVTLLQLARAYAIFGNGGLLPDLRFLKTQGVPPAPRVMDAAIADAICRMLEEVVQPGGTAVLAQVEGYRIGGKTGTIRKLEDGGYVDSHVALFAGLAPMSAPLLSVAVVIDEPSDGIYYGGRVAAPVFSEIVAESLRFLKIPPDVPDPASPKSPSGTMAGIEAAFDPLVVGSGYPNNENASR